MTYTDAFNRLTTITPGMNLFSPFILVYYNFHVNIRQSNPSLETITISFRNYGDLFSPIKYECENIVDAIFKLTPKWEIKFLLPQSEISKYNNFRVERSDLKYE